MPSAAEQLPPKPIPAAAVPATPSNPEAAAENQYTAAQPHNCISNDAQSKAAEARHRQDPSAAGQSGPAPTNQGPDLEDAARLGHAAQLMHPCSSLEQPAHHAVTRQLHVREQSTALLDSRTLQASQPVDAQQHMAKASCVEKSKPHPAEPVDAQPSITDNSAAQQSCATYKGLQADRSEASTALPTQPSSSHTQRRVNTAAPQHPNLIQTASARAQQSPSVRAQQTASAGASQIASVSAQQVASVSIQQTASFKAQQTGSVSAQQTAAEMLRWLDATLAAKKHVSAKLEIYTWTDTIEMSVDKTFL